MMRAKTCHTILTGMVSLLVSLPAAAADRIEAPNWDRDLALQTAVLNIDEAQLDGWFTMLRTGEGARLLGALKAFGDASILAAPARDRQLFLFTTGLAGFPAASVPSKLVEFLEACAPLTLVPHDENVSRGVPLFNIPAAAQGVEHGMQRQIGKLRSAELLRSAPEAWIAAYLSATAPARAGFLDALDNATPRQTSLLGMAALQALGEWPELFRPAARSALATADQAAIEKLIMVGANESLSSLLRSASARLPGEIQAQILLTAIQYAPAENAALAIGILAPGLDVVPEVTESLFDLLEDHALGSAAALALSRHLDPAVRERLRTLAADGSMVAGRARLALELSAEGAVQ